MILKSKYIGSLLLVALMLTTTIGIGIYRHTCLVTGHEGMSIFIGANTGKKDAMCCSKKTANDKEKTGCCEETGSFYQLDIPQINQQQFAYQAPLLRMLYTPPLPTFDYAVAEITTNFPLYNILPPPKLGQHLAQLQVYRL
ncbi:hypothetical protein BH09BAC1_BH09BAC1_19680 [soil metagenome]